MCLCPNCNVDVDTVNNQCPRCHYVLIQVPAAMKVPTLVGSFGVHGQACGHGNNCGCGHGNNLAANQTVNIGGGQSLPVQTGQPQVQPQPVVVQPVRSPTPWWAWLLIVLATLGLLTGATLGIIALSKGATTSEVKQTVADGNKEVVKDLTKVADEHAKVAHEELVAAGKSLIKEVNDSGEQTTKELAKAIADGNKEVTKDLTKAIADGNDKVTKAIADDLKETRRQLRWAISSRASKADVDAAQARMEAAIKAVKIQVKLVDERK